LRFPEEPGRRIEGKAEAVAAAVREDLVDVRHDVAQLRGRESHAGLLLDLSHCLCGHVGERVVSRRRAVRVQPEDYTGQMRIVGRGTAKLIVRLPRPERSAGEVL